MRYMREIKLRQIKGGLFPKYELLEPFRYEFYHGDEIAFFVIPKGFQYDGATMGSFLFWRKSAHTATHTAAHDWGYTVLGKVKARYDEDDEYNFHRTFDLTRYELDYLFERGLAKDLNVQSWRRYIAWAAIRSVGGLFWYKRKWGF